MLAKSLYVHIHYFILRGGRDGCYNIIFLCFQARQNHYLLVNNNFSKIYECVYFLFLENISILHCLGSFCINMFS